MIFDKAVLIRTHRQHHRVLIRLLWLFFVFFRQILLDNNPIIL